MKKLLLTLILGMFLISFASALETLGTFKQGEEIRISQVCSDATYINISSIAYPNSSVAISNIEMTSAGSGEFYYDFSLTETTGTYQVRGISDGCEGTFATSFEITATGKSLTPEKATSYSIIFFISLLIFVGLLWVGIALPSNNKSDEFTGYILAVRNIKYVKYVLLGFSYITLVWISYFTWMMSYAYLDFEFLTTIFRFIFTFLAVATLPLFILFVYLTITNLIRDSQVADALMRGLRVK